MRAILEEVHWELDTNGYKPMQIFLFGGLKREDVARYRDLDDAFGVGGSIASALVIDFALDIVEIEGTTLREAGKWSAIKQVYALSPLQHHVLPEGAEPSAGALPLLRPFLENGQIIARLTFDEARKQVQDILIYLKERKEP